MEVARRALEEDPSYLLDHAVEVVDVLKFQGFLQRDSELGLGHGLVDQLLPATAVYERRLGQIEAGASQWLKKVVPDHEREPEQEQIFAGVASKPFVELRAAQPQLLVQHEEVIASEGHHALDASGSGAEVAAVPNDVRGVDDEHGSPS